MGEIDPILLEIIRHGLIATAEEMKLHLARTAYNPILYEVLDFSCGVFDAGARLLAQADGLPIFLGALGAAVRCVIADIGADRMEDGDVFLFNDPYEQGNHINDVTTVAPVLVDGGLVAFAVTRAHWLDIGGKDPGGSIDSVDVVQEGLWLRSIRLVAAGRTDDNLMRMIGANVRGRDAMLGDLRAQLAASRTGCRRLLSLWARYGAQTVAAATARMQSQGAARTRRFLESIADGVYEAESSIDSDGLGSGPLRVHVRATVEGDRIRIDLSGSAPQARGPLNCGAAAALASCRIAVKALSSPAVAACDGDFEPIEIVFAGDVPTIFNARYPAPTFLYGKQLTEVLIKALARAVPGRAIAGNYDDLAGFMLTGPAPGGERWIHQEPEVGGWGAGAECDGESALIFVGDGDARNIPAEVLEARYPLRLERHELRVDSGGPGFRRGGLGIAREYRVLSGGVRMLAVMDRTVNPPWPIGEGHPGEPSVVRVAPPDEVYTWVNSVPVAKGALVSVLTGGGGGWGDPANRERERIVADLEAGYITEAHAERAYGYRSGSDDL